MKTLRCRATSLALALLFAIGATSMSAAKTFVYVSNAQDGNIDAYSMDTGTGVLTPLGKTEAGKLVMPIDRTFRFDEAEAAQARMRTNAHFGKIVMVVG